MSQLLNKYLSIEFVFKIYFKIDSKENVSRKLTCFERKLGNVCQLSRNGTA